MVAGAPENIPGPFVIVRPRGVNRSPDVRE